MQTPAAVAFAIITLGVVGFQLALAAGAPWGEYAMGGKFPGAYPAPMRVAAVVQAALLAAIAWTVLAAADLAPAPWPTPGWAMAPARTARHVRYARPEMWARPEGNMDRRFRFWWWWLVALAAGTVVSGLALVVFPVATGPLASRVFLGSSDKIAGFGSEGVAYSRFVSAILGAVIAGWSAAILYALLVPFKRGDLDAWRLIAVSLAVWFVPDTAYSLISGFWPNAVVNCASLLLFVVPLAATRRYFVPKRT